MTEENSLKLFINKANEKWIIDRLRDEWIRNHNPFTRFYKSANMLWIIAPWKWDNTKLEKTYQGRLYVRCIILMKKNLINPK